MQAYKAEDIRNIAVLGHSGSGKTSFCEAVLYRGGVTERLGDVQKGTSTLDFSAAEKRRNISIDLGVSSVEWKGTKVNLIDTPGDFDFLGEVNQALRVADSAIVVLSARSQVTVGAEKSFRFLERENIPYAIFVNKMDDDVADWTKTMIQIREQIGRSATIMMLPIREGSAYTGYVDILTKRAYKYNENNERYETEIPDNLVDEVERQYENLMEQIAESSDELVEKFFMDEEFTEEEIQEGLRNRILTRNLIPIWAGSSTELRGVRFTMNRIIYNMPSPSETLVEPAIKPDGTAVQLKTNFAGTLAGLVFKTYTDPYVGKISLVRLYSGTLTTNQELWNERTRSTDKAAGLSSPQGSKQEPMSTVYAGDIVAITKLDDTKTGDTLSDKSNPLTLPGIVYPASPLALAIYPKTEGEEDKVALGIVKITEEDPTIKLNQSEETGEQLVSGLGELHLDVLVEKLKNKYNVEAELRTAKTPYREKLRRAVKSQGKHRKQSGGHGQYGDVIIEFEPHEDVDLIFEESIFGGSVPKSYFPAVEKGLIEATNKGPLAGYKVVGLKANLVDGSYHDVDSSELAFSLAAQLAYREAFKEAGADLLEPIYEIEIHAPETDLGTIMSDISKRRGRISGIDQKAGMSIVNAHVPLAELDRYATDLRAMTQGRGWYNTEFYAYENMPQQLQEKVIQEHQANA